MTRKPYPSDMSDEEWTLLGPLIPTPKVGGRPAKWERQEIVNAIFYVLRGGIAWRLLPHDLPPWKTTYHYFREWRLAGLWEEINHKLHKQVRVQLGRKATPSAAIVDSQSVKTTEKGGSKATMGPRKSRGV